MYSTYSVQYVYRKNDSYTMFDGLDTSEEHLGGEREEGVGKGREASQREEGVERPPEEARARDREIDARY